MTVSDASESSSPSNSLTATGRVVLALVAFGKTTGYEIKQFVDRSVRFFWAASYGQIYPELRRLEEQGLIKGRPEPTGGRARTVYELTDEGRTALERWLATTDEPLWELRDEGMLKLFFSGSTTPEQRLRNIRAMRARHEAKLAALKAVEPHAAQGPIGPRLTLEIGLGSTQWMIDWCIEAERRLGDAGGER